MRSEMVLRRSSRLTRSSQSLILQLLRGRSTAEEKRLGYERMAAAAEMGYYDDHPDGPPPEVFERYCLAVRRCCEYEEGEGERKKYLDQLDSY